MTHYQKYILPGGQEIVAEIVGPDAAGEVQAARPRLEDLAGQAGESIQKALATIQPLTRAVIDQVAAIGDAVTEVTVEFSVKLSGGTNLILATVSGEANFKIGLKLARAPFPAGPPVATITSTSGPDSQPVPAPPGPS